MTGYSPGGSSLYSDSDYMSADYSNAIIIESGISKFDKLTLQKLLTGKTAGAYPYVGELNEGFNGSSNQKPAISTPELRTAVLGRKCEFVG